MKIYKRIFRNLLFTTLPIFIFILLEILFKNTLFSILTASGISIILLLIYLMIYKKPDLFLIADIVFITIIGGISLIIDSPILFKLKPAIIECFLLLVFVFISISTRAFKAFFSHYYKDIDIPEENVSEIQMFLLYLVPVIFLHMLLIVVSSVFFSEKVWALISCGLLYVFVFFIFISIKSVGFFQRRYFVNKYKNDEWFDIVDEESRVLGKAPRSICHNGTKLLHPVVHVHIFNSSKKLLLQKRKLTKKIQPGKWDTSVGGHIMSGESLEDALKREIKEEVGLDVDIKELVPISKYVYESDVEKELVFSFVLFNNGPFDHQKEEIDEVKYFDFAKLNKMIQEDKTTENFKKEFTLLMEYEINFFS